MLHDEDIREPLFEFLEDSFGKVRILQEKTMGKSRADVIMVMENKLVGLEIKSDADTYQRLSSQVKDYDLYYDENYVVIGTSHAMHIKEHVPEYWGIVTAEEVDEKLDFYIYRKPQINPKMKLQRKLQILWRPELHLIQQMNEMPKYKAESKDFVIRKIIERLNFPEGKKGKIDLSRLQNQISEVLFERDYNNVTDTLREYYKGELQKEIEMEEDETRKMELIIKQTEKRISAQKSGYKKKKRANRLKIF